MILLFTQTLNIYAGTFSFNNITTISESNPIFELDSEIQNLEHSIIKLNNNLSKINSNVKKPN